MNKHKFVAMLTRIVGIITITALLLVAIYVSLGRILLPQLSQYQHPIEAWLSESLNVQISTESITGYWGNFSPGILLQGVSISTNSKEAPGIRLGRVAFLLDIPASLQHWRPVFSLIKITDSDFVLKRDESGTWTLLGQKFGTHREKHNTSIELIKILILQQKILLQDIRLQLVLAQGQLKEAVIETALLQCTDLQCTTQTDLQLKMDDRVRAVHLAAHIHNNKKAEQVNIDAYAQWEPVILDSWLALIDANLPVKLQLAHCEVGGQAWLNVQHGQVALIQGDLKLPKLQLLTQEQQSHSFADISTQFSWVNTVDKQNNHWTLQLDQLDFTWQQQQFGPAHLQAELIDDRTSHEFRLAVDSIDLALASNALLAVENLPSHIKDILRTLNPRGSITNTQLLYRIPEKETPQRQNEPRFQLKTNLNGATVSAWKNAPAAAGVNGYLELTPNSGLVFFTGDNLQVHFPNLYANSWNFSQASGLISWFNQGRALWLDGSNIKLETGSTIAGGQFSLTLPDLNAEAPLEPRLDIAIDIKHSTTQEALSFVPDRKLNPELLNWLNGSLHAGAISDSAFIFSGSIIKGAPIAQNSILLDAHAHQLNLNYHKDWPALSKANAKITLSGQDVLVKANQATLLNSQVKKMTARYDGATKTVRVNTHIEGPLQDLLYTIQQTPIRANLFDLVDDFRLSGTMDLELELELPLKNLLHTQAQLTLAMQDANFTIPSLNLFFENIDGNMGYSTQNGLSGSEITGQFLGEGFTAKITSQPREPRTKSHSTQITMQGTMGAKSLYQWQKTSALSRLQGATRYQAEVNLGTDNDFIRINTDLSGMQVLLPAPYGKETGETVPLELTMELKDTPLHHLQYGNLLQYILRFDGTNYTEGQIRLGGDLPVFNEDQGIRITGRTPRLDYNEWDTLIQDLKQEASKAATVKSEQPSVSAIDYLKQIRLNADQLSFNGQELQDVILKIDQSANDWAIKLESPVVKGLIKLFEDTERSSEINIEYLHLPESIDGSDDALAAVSPQQLKAMNIQVAEFKIGEKNYGNWKFNLRPTDKGARASELVAQLRGMKISGDLDWRHYQGHHRTHFLGRVKTKQLGKSLQAWGYPPSIEAKSSRINGSVAWDGSPANFDIKRLQGTFNWDAKNGKLIELNGVTDALRVFGIINVNSLARRLRLDFSDLFQKGYSFDTLRGGFELNKGLIKINDSLVIDGPSAKFMIDGTADMNNKTLDQELIVVLPLSENIPIAATIAGAPLVGIPLYILNKAFGNIFERFTSARYQLNGDWDNPQIKLVKVFENKASTSSQNNKNSQPEPSKNTQTEPQKNLEVSE